MMLRMTALAVALTASATAGINLANYSLQSTVALPPTAAAEASAVTFNWDTGNLLVLGDEGDALVEITRSGAVVSTMTLTGFADTEGLTYIGNGEFVITEERLQSAYKFTYTGGGAIDRSAMPTVNLGPSVGNIGIEGISYDRRNGRYVTVKEKTPQAVSEHTINFGAGTAVTTSVFDPSGLGLLDLSDVSTLTSVSALVGTAAADNLLIYSQESQMLLEVDRAGNILSQFSFAGISGIAEGVTIDDNGVIYIVDESPNLYILIPAPGSAALAVMGLAVAARRRR
jgi:uncharacterized protein YjiK